MTEINTAIPIEESSGIKLDPTEEQILKDQIDVPEGKVSYITLYRFATILDRIIMFIGLVFSAGTGTIMPVVITFSGIMADNYTRFQNHTISISYFNEEINRLSVILVCFAIATLVTTYISVATWAYT
ncbi:12617_t:CDS:2, partial [Dentiscutata heterogama]